MVMMSWFHRYFSWVYTPSYLILPKALCDTCYYPRLETEEIKAKERGEGTSSEYDN